MENYLKRKGKKIVLQDDDGVEEIAQAVQHLNTKLNSLKVGKSTKQLKDSLSIRGTAEKCPKPCPSVSFDLNPIEITDASQFGENEVITYTDQMQPVELENFPEVESIDSLTLILSQPCMLKWTKVVFIA